MAVCQHSISKKEALGLLFLFSTTPIEKPLFLYAMPKIYRGYIEQQSKELRSITQL
jgi:hypothetical protein